MLGIRRSNCAHTNTRGNLVLQLEGVALRDRTPVIPHINRIGGNPQLDSQLGDASHMGDGFLLGHRDM